MPLNRANAILSILKGLLLAIVLTLLGMLAIAALVVLARISDGWLTALNQILKAAAIIAGACTAVGRGGHRGFFTGAALAMLYMVLGYALYVALGGGAFNVGSMLGEVVVGVAVGGVTGAILANMAPRKRRRARGT